MVIVVSSHTPLSHVIVISRKWDSALKSTINDLLTFLNEHNINHHIEIETARYYQLSGPTLAVEDIQSQHDLMLVIGGDGSILQAAPHALANDMAILGINRGRLGFLTDLSDPPFTHLLAILSGKYTLEPRQMLRMTLQDELGQVLLPGTITHMIEFDIEIDGEYVCSQRADGIIAATPTGSTAHALSAGGPILFPTLNCTVLVPLCPHKLSSRPVVIDTNREIVLRICSSNRHAPKISVDGGAAVTAPVNSTVRVVGHQRSLKLIHPLGHDYFNTLRQKLGWESR
jgi:NAD+ kinase